MSTARRLTAVIVALLLTQFVWAGNASAYMTAHAMTGAEAHGSMMAGGMASHDPCCEHPEQSHSPVDEGTPSHCPLSTMPASCSTMLACSAAVMVAAAGPLWSTERLDAEGRVAEPAAHPVSLAAAPDVPPPRG